jgi:hypothetical protein
MGDLETLREFLNGARVDAAVFSLWPDYRAVLLAVDGIVPGPSDQASDTLLQAAEASARDALSARPVEDLPSCAGAPRLLRAAGTEAFDTVAGGIEVIEHPDPGEVVWCDDAGVTCRRWNWRQGQRTQLREDTTTALFILDALHPMTDEALDGAADDLAARLAGLAPDVRIARRRIAAAPSTQEGS